MDTTGAWLQRQSLGRWAPLALAVVAVLATGGAADSSTLRHITFSATYTPAALPAARTVNMARVPKARAASLARAAWPMPATGRPSPAAKRRAASNPGAPSGGAPVRLEARTSLTPNTPIGGTKWDGLSSAVATCPYASGCSPPDMALAASAAWVMQGVNTSFAVYSPGGVIQPGWPKTAQSFFGIPNVPGNCDPPTETWRTQPIRG